MCDSGSLRVGKMDLLGEVGISINLGSHNMILTIHNHTRENATVARVSLIVFGLSLGP